MNASMLLWLLGVMATGLVLVVWGLRGKRLNDHPVCRQCRFDLSGQPDGTVTCPECGAGLKREGSIRTGQRRKRPIVIGVGVLGVLAPMLAIGTLVFALITGTDLNKYKPLALLEWESARAPAPKAKLIGAELHRRMLVKGVEQETYDRIVQVALTHQGDAKRAWATEWGDIIEQADMDSKLSKEDKSRYRRQAAVVKFEARPRVTLGQEIPVVASLKEARIGSAASMWSMLLFDSASVDGKKARKGVQRHAYDNEGFAMAFGGMDMPNIGSFQLMGAANRMGWGGNAWGEAAFTLKTPSEVEPGFRPVSVTIGMKMVDQSRSITWPNKIKEDDPDSKLHDGELAVEVLPKETKSVEVVEATPELEEKLKVLLEPSNCMVYQFDSSQPPHVMLQFSIEGRPMDFAFDVILKTPQKEWKLSPLTSGRLAGWQTHYGPGMDNQRSVNAMLRNFSATTADLILRPSESLAAQTVDLTRIYGGEIVIEDVEIRWQDQTGRVTLPRTQKKKSSGGSWKPLLDFLGL